MDACAPSSTGESAGGGPSRAAAVQAELQAELLTFLKRANADAPQRDEGSADVGEHQRADASSTEGVDTGEKASSPPKDRFAPPKRGDDLVSPGSSGAASAASGGKHRRAPSPMAHGSTDCTGGEGQAPDGTPSTNVGDPSPVSLRGSGCVAGAGATSTTLTGASLASPGDHSTPPKHCKPAPSTSRGVPSAVVLDAVSAAGRAGGCCVLHGDLSREHGYFPADTRATFRALRQSVGGSWLRLAQRLPLLSRSGSVRRAIREEFDLVDVAALPDDAVRAALVCVGMLVSTGFWEAAQVEAVGARDVEAIAAAAAAAAAAAREGHDDSAKPDCRTSSTTAAKTTGT